MALTLIKESAANISSLAKLKKAMKSGYSFKPSDVLNRYKNIVSRTFKGFGTDDQGNMFVQENHYGPHAGTVVAKSSGVLAHMDKVATMGRYDLGDITKWGADKLAEIHKQYYEGKDKS